MCVSLGTACWGGSLALGSRLFTHFMSWGWFTWSICLAVPVYPVVRTPSGGAAQGCSYHILFLCWLKLPEMLSVASSSGNRCFSAVERQWEIYWKTVWMDIKRVLVFSSAHLLATCWLKSVLERSMMWSVPSSRQSCLWCPFFRLPSYMIWHTLLGNSSNG